MNLAACWTSRRGLFAVAFGAFGLVAAGVALGELLSLNPCPLCIFQRVLYLLVGLLALLAGLGSERPALRLGAGGLAVLTAAGGMTTALYQSWLQWFPTPSMECGLADPTLIERLVDWLGQLWPYMFLATGFCSSKEWVFLGLSMANWSIVCFLALGVLAALSLRRSVRG